LEGNRGGKKTGKRKSRGEFGSVAPVKVNGVVEGGGGVKKRVPEGSVQHNGTKRNLELEGRESSKKKQTH